MAELSRQDLNILKSYAYSDNRELYWNYLAQLPGNDGYGVLALGVVRNDNVPGQVANAYADAYAAEHSGKHMTERDWENFGQQLIKEDYWRRERQFSDEHRPDLALNLPAKDVQSAHDLSFKDAGIDPNAWTPRKLLEAARRQGGEPEAEKIWSMMLDNRHLGLDRGVHTLAGVAERHADPKFDAGSYVADMAKARLAAHEARPNTDPDVIGNQSFYYAYETQHKRWVNVSEVEVPNPAITGPVIDTHPVTDPKLIEELNDTRALRLHRQELSHAFHPDDPGRRITTPKTIADVPESAAQFAQATAPRPGDDPLYAALRLRLPIEVSDDHVAQATLLAKQGGIRDAARLDQVVLHGDQIHMRGLHHGNATLDLNHPAPPSEASLQQAAQLDQQHAQAQQTQQLAMQQQPGPTMSH